MATNNLRQTANLLTAGILAGPFFIALALLQAFTRKGFDIVRHPASMLSLGDLGFIQIANFVITGVLFIACAVGLKRFLTDGVGRKWISRLFTVVGFAFILGGVFVPDPSLGFPPGAPEGMPEKMSWHSVIHGFAPVIGSLAMSSALVIFARRSWKHGRRGQAVASILVVVVSFVLTSLTQITGDWERGVFNFIPFWIGVTVLFCYPAVIVAKLKQEQIAAKFH